MKFRYLGYISAIFWLLVALNIRVEAQTLGQVQAQTRNGQGLYVKLMGGAAVYGGDNDGLGAASKPLEAFRGYVKHLGASGRAEIGYAFNDKVEVGVAAEYAQYPLIEPNRGAFAAPFAAGKFKDTHRIHGEVLARYTFAPQASVRPFVQLGATVARGHLYDAVTFAKSKTLGYGANAGAGVEVELSKKTSLVIETAQNIVFPDKAIDGADYKVQFGDTSDKYNMDVLGFYGAGLKLKSGASKSCTPAQVLHAEGKPLLKIGEVGDFIAEVTPDRNVTYNWDFGDGITDSALKATHVYPKEGTYTVTFTATNCGGTDVKSFTIDVGDKQEIKPVNLIALSASNSAPVAKEQVRFSAQVEGTEPISYKWNFGDGSTANTLSPTHSFNSDGKYTVTLEVQNVSGIDRRSMVVDVKTNMTGGIGSIPCNQITELNATYFDFGRAILDANAQSRLRENVEVLKECPNIKVRLNGFTDHSEQNPEYIAQRRIQAVTAFYRSAGITPSRIQSAFTGRDADNCDKEDPGRGCRRSRRGESIPML